MCVCVYDVSWGQVYDIFNYHAYTCSDLVGAFYEVMAEDCRGWESKKHSCRKYHMPHLNIIRK